MMDFKIIAKEVLKDKWNNFVCEFKVYAQVFGPFVVGIIVYILYVYNEYFRGVL